MLEPDLFKWATWMENAEENRRVALTEVGDAKVSTVFLGLDYAFGGGQPILFETMIFGDDNYSDYQERYHTLEEAMLGHERAVAMVQGTGEPKSP